MHPLQAMGLPPPIIPAAGTGAAVTATTTKPADVSRRARRASATTQHELDLVVQMEECEDFLAATAAPTPGDDKSTGAGTGAAATTGAGAATTVADGGGAKMDTDTAGDGGGAKMDTDVAGDGKALSSMSNKELKAVITGAGLKYHDCFEVRAVCCEHRGMVAVFHWVAAAVRWDTPRGIAK